MPLVMPAVPVRDLECPVCGGPTWRARDDAAMDAHGLSINTRLLAVLASEARCIGPAIHACAWCATARTSTLAGIALAKGWWLPSWGAELELTYDLEQARVYDDRRAARAFATAIGWDPKRHLKTRRLGSGLRVYVFQTSDGRMLTSTDAGNIWRAWGEEQARRAKAAAAAAPQEGSPS